jgi:membrane protein DedA with SNARE-associated domain
MDSASPDGGLVTGGFVFALLLARLQLWLTQAAVLGTLISLDTLKNALTTLGYPAVALFIMIESSGIPFPGETMLLLASFYAGTTGQLSIFWVLVACSIGAILGDNLGYLAGRYGGRPFALRFGKYLFLKEHHLDQAEKFFQKHGDKTVFFGRFVAVLRAWAAFLAGVNRMRWYKFLAYNAAGGICWATLMGLFGYFAGKIIGNNFDEIEKLGQSLGFAALAIVVLPVAYFIVRARLRQRRRQSEATLALAPAQEEEEPASPVK